MSTIIKYKSGYAIRLDIPSDDGTRKQKFISGFLSTKDAKAALIQLESEIQTGKYRPPCELRISDFIEIWLRDHVRELAPKTREHYHYLTSLISASIGSVPMSDLRANQIERMYRDLRAKDTLHENTIQHIHKTLRSMLNTAVRWDYIETSPIPKVKAPKRIKPTMNFWTVDEIRKGIAALNGSSILYHVQVSLYTGLRLGEVCGLKEEDINFEKNYFTVSRTLQSVDGSVNIKAPKTEKSRRKIPMSPDIAVIFKSRIRAIKEQRMLYRDKYDESWLGYLSVHETGEIQTDQYVGRKWRKIMAKLNYDAETKQDRTPDDPLYLKPIRFHDLRHSCASWLLFLGFDLKEIQEILGHSSYTITADMYLHLHEEVLNKKMVRMIL